jgi:SRSO17 transposase
MAAKLAPDSVRRMHQSLHHLVADAPWDDEALLDRALDTVLPSVLRQGPVVAWVVDDTGFPKKGRHSVGVTRQYCGQVCKQDNCRVAVSLSVTTEIASLPIAFRLYLPEVWAKDKPRREKAGVPEEIEFQTKPEIALAEIKRARERGVPEGVVLADAGYGNDTQFRAKLTEWKLSYAVGIQSSVTIRKPGEQPAPAPKGKGLGRPPKLLQRDPQHQPITVKEFALSLPANAWKKVLWRQGVKDSLTSCFGALRVRPAHRDYWRAEPHPEEWLLIEWPEGESEPTKYWFSTLPEDLPLTDLVHFAKHRWIIERDYEELKQELGLGHFLKDEAGVDFTITRLFASSRMGSWWPSGAFFPPQHAPVILDYAPRNRRKASGRAVPRVRLERHNPRSIATIRIIIGRHLIALLPQCPCCGSRSG